MVHPTSPNISDLSAPASYKGKGKANPLLTLLDDLSQATLIKQGAEAKVYRLDNLLENTFPPSVSAAGPAISHPLLFKHRFPKAYRHSELDTALTKNRTHQEAKSLIRCLKSGTVDVPKIVAVDAHNGVLIVEWIDGPGSVREVLGGLPEEDADVPCPQDEQNNEGADGAQWRKSSSISEKLRSLRIDEDSIMRAIGNSIGSMHNIDVIHGDLTTSNMLLRSSRPTSGSSAPQVVLIDFGLSYVSTLVEDKAVDLYVLERALASTHPEPEDQTETFISKILAGYCEAVGEKEWHKVQRRLKAGASEKKMSVQGTAFLLLSLLDRQCVLEDVSEAWLGNQECSIMGNGLWHIVMQGQRRKRASADILSHSSCNLGHVFDPPIIPSCLLCGLNYVYTSLDGLALSSLPPALQYRGIIVAGEKGSDRRRLASFLPQPRRRNQPAQTKWPHPKSFSVTPDSLARSGFKYDPTPTSNDNVTCVYCNKGLEGWEEGDDALDEHLKRLDSETGEKCGWATIMGAKREYDRLVQDSGDLSSLQDPRSEQLEMARKRTFGPWWKHDGKKGWKPTSAKLAAAGFYNNPGIDAWDTCACIYCDIQLDGWEKGDDPEKEHIKRQPACFFFASRPIPDMTKRTAGLSEATASRPRKKTQPKNLPQTGTRTRAASKMPDVVNSAILEPPAVAEIPPAGQPTRARNTPVTARRENSSTETTHRQETESRLDASAVAVTVPSKSRAKSSKASYSTYNNPVSLSAFETSLVSAEQPGQRVNGSKMESDLAPTQRQENYGDAPAPESAHSLAESAPASSLVSISYNDITADSIKVQEMLDVDQVFSTGIIQNYDSAHEAVRPMKQMPKRLTISGHRPTGSPTPTNQNSLSLSQHDHQIRLGPDAHLSSAPSSVLPRPAYFSTVPVTHASLVAPSAKVSSQNTVSQCIGKEIPPGGDKLEAWLGSLVTHEISRFEAQAVSIMGRWDTEVAYKRQELSAILH